MRKLTWLALVPILCMGGCLAVDDVGVGGRAGMVNRSAAEYANESVLLNVLRAKAFEPLDFATLGQYTGHSDYTVALPTITIPPTAGPTYAINNNVNTYALRVDQQMNIPDNPDTYKALTNSIEPQNVATFLRQGFPRALVFFLLINDIREGKKGTVLANDPSDGIQFRATTAKIADFIEAGLTVDANGYCFDPALPPPIAGPSKAYPGYGPRCGGGRSNNNTLVDPQGISYRLEIRSVYGVYQYLGAILRSKTTYTGLLPPQPNDEPIIVITNGAADCFALTYFEGENYCVPRSATNSKIAFSFLRHLFNLLAKPNPPTLPTTVRAIPS